MPSSSDRTAAAEAPATPITVGTAGHIDHGKTLLVEQLTGMRADRPYERDRGMTIDIGYAEMRTERGQRVGFVDLPGHERFIRNMVAGATGIDLALLVVAADDGVMPQTREHVEILDLLGVRRGLAVLNKADLVDEETRELAVEELWDFLGETGLADLEILTCSAATGDGVEAVRRTLLALVEQAAHEDDPGAFFLGVQRSFAATGFGCIATGVPSAGTVRVGDDVELLPSGGKARVRAIEIYHEPAEAARAGHRTALNLSGVHHDDVKRGMVVAEPGAYRPGRHVAARLRMLPSARRALKHAAPVRLLTGTLEEMAAVYLLSGDALKPGEDALVEVRARRPVTARDGAPFIVRSSNALETLGGGRIVTVLEKPIGRRAKARHERLAAWEEALDSAEARLRAALDLEAGGTAAELARRAQLERSAAARLLAGMRDRGELVELPGGNWLAETRVSAATADMRRALEKMHREQPLVAALPLADVRDRAGVTEQLVAVAAERLGDEVVLEARTIRLAEHTVELDPEVRAATEAVLACLAEARFAPPEKDKLADAAGIEPDRLEKALTVLSDTRAVRRVAPDVIYRKEDLDEGLRLLHAVAEKRGSVEPVDAKAVLGGISRKWLIPLLEFYDRIGAMRRDGNARVLTRRGRAMVDGGIDAE